MVGHRAELGRLGRAATAGPHVVAALGVAAGELEPESAVGAGDDDPLGSRRMPEQLAGPVEGRRLRSAGSTRIASMPTRVAPSTHSGVSSRNTTASGGDAERLGGVQVGLGSGLRTPMSVASTNASSSANSGRSAKNSLPDERVGVVGEHTDAPPGGAGVAHQGDGAGSIIASGTASARARNSPTKPSKPARPATQSHVRWRRLAVATARASTAPSPGSRRRPPPR